MNNDHHEMLTPSFDMIKNAIIDGNIVQVVRFLAITNCQFHEFQEINEEDVYKIACSLLTYAVNNPKMLTLLLNSNLIHPNEFGSEAFYTCLNLGLIDSLKCFASNPRFVLPQGCLIKAATLGGIALVELFLTHFKTSRFHFSADEINQALIIASKNNDTEIVKMLLSLEQKTGINPAVDDHISLSYVLKNNNIDLMKCFIQFYRKNNIEIPKSLLHYPALNETLILLQGTKKGTDEIHHHPQPLKEKKLLHSISLPNLFKHELPKSNQLPSSSNDLRSYLPKI